MKNNPPPETPVGQGGALSFASCIQSFDNNLSPCSVSDTTFIGNNAAQKGGAVAVSSGKISPTTIEFHRCLIINSTTGKYIEDDPQGEGGAFSLSEGLHLVLEDCVVANSTCGKKVCVLLLTITEKMKREIRGR